MIGLGPFPITIVVALLAAVSAFVMARLSARRLPEAPSKTAGALVVDALFVGLLAARLGYVLRWWPQYAAAPWSVISIGDGGFAWWAGLPAAVGFLLWRTRSMRVLRRPTLLGVAAGLAVWLAASGTLTLLQHSAPPLPDTPLVTLDGTPKALSAYTGTPVVVNLWATWCPPCRREMPALAEAQARYPDVRFILANQGEDAATIQRFLEAENLALSDVLRDPGSDIMRTFGSRGLPTTLFFDADGGLVDTHMGELTRASLADTLRRRFDAHPNVSPASTE
ncbi:TlpA disulfide reductase family protein [Stenotrophomonas sp. PS02297]|uniref:TlpA disulfide reductase family protein n=1 Tax=unclassified Stenotrophomonas TaxID=196198 RepID=UPI00249CB1D2|nr:TlpA disulfide reductase family protein [Stenotrophomonas sp. PS02297]